ncbi:MAG: alpha/beta hydrolase [bacterium]|nr:alpha/beta hydrolase [bacterium]
MESETRKIDVGGHKLRLSVAGNGPPDFLCLHGLVDRIEIWKRLVGPLSERGRVACIDQRGHGESEAPPGPYRREDLASDVSATIRELGAEKVVLVGHSMGGIISMTTALSHPEQVAGLVLIGTASQCNEKTAGWYERIAQAGEKDGNAGLAQAIYRGRGNKVIEGDAQGIADVTRTLKSLYEDPLTPKLSAITCPVLLIVGDKDPMGPKASSIIAARFPDAELVTVADCGHWVHVEEPEAVLDAIDRFLARLDS